MALVLENGDSLSINFPVDQIKANNKLFRRFGALINFHNSLIKKGTYWKHNTYFSFLNNNAKKENPNKEKKKNSGVTK